MKKDIAKLEAAKEVCDRMGGSLPNGWWELSSKLQRAIEELKKREKRNTA